MLATYRTAFESLAATTEALLKAVEALPQPGTPPAEGGWSGIQVVRHLIGAETGILTLLEKNAAKPANELLRAGLGSWFRARLMSWMLRRPDKRFKVPARLGEPLAADVDVDHLRQQWAALHQRLGRFLVAFPPSHAQRTVFEHPRAGWLTVTQTLRFMADHVRHHQQQVARLANARRA